MDGRYPPHAPHAYVRNVHGRLRKYAADAPGAASAPGAVSARCDASVRGDASARAPLVVACASARSARLQRAPRHRR